MTYRELLNLYKQGKLDDVRKKEVEHNNVLVSLKLLVRSANVLGCSLEALLDRAAAVEWAGAHCTDGGEEAENKGKSECKSRCGTDAEGQEQYSLEEVRLLLKLLQIQRNICSYR